MKKIHLIMVILFILTVLLMISGLLLIYSSTYYHFDHYLNNNSAKKISFFLKKMTGFGLLKHISAICILNNSAKLISLISDGYLGYYSWIQLQIGIIFSIILVPILFFISSSLIFLSIGFKIKLNNNFWDMIQKCEIMIT